MVEDFRAVLAELVKANARFLVVGAHALAVHGVPRATVDLDVWIDRSPENARRVWAALSAFGAPLHALKIEETDFLRPDVVVQFEDVPVPFIGRAAFIRNKRATGRKKDLADLEALGGEC